MRHDLPVGVCRKLPEVGAGALKPRTLPRPRIPSCFLLPSRWLVGSWALGLNLFWRRGGDSNLRGLEASRPSESGRLRLVPACQQDRTATEAGLDAWRGSERGPMRCHRMSELTKAGARPAPSLRARAAGVA